MADRPLSDLNAFSITITDTPMTCRQPARTEATSILSGNLRVLADPNETCGTATAQRKNHFDLPHHGLVSSVCTTQRGHQI